jgi:hypothetical protein
MVRVLPVVNARRERSYVRRHTRHTTHTATHNRKARYFVLKTDNVLYYWKSPQHVAKKSNGRVPLTGAKV